MIKMAVAPQFNYVSMMLPLNLSPLLFKQYVKIIKDFLWDKKKSRINIKKMWSSRDAGGLGVKCPERASTGRGWNRSWPVPSDHRTFFHKERGLMDMFNLTTT